MQDISVNTLSGAFAATLQVPRETASAVVAAAGLAAALPVYSYDQIAGVLINGLGGEAGGLVKFNAAAGTTLTFNLAGISNGAVQTLARTALQLWSDASGLLFSEVASGGQLVFRDDQTGAFASQTTAGGFATGAEVNVGTGWVSSYGTGINSYTFQTYIHEVGHALGLSHAGDYNGSATYSVDASYANDSWATTIMSYFDQRSNTYFANQGFSYAYVVTPQMADLLAMRALYGGTSTLRTGNTTYGYNSTAGAAMFNAALYANVALTIEDDGGIDTLDYSNTFATQVIDLNPESFSNVNGYNGNLAIARGTIIENAIGGNGSDTLIGNAAINVLNGGGGNDTLMGGGGADQLFGGAGTDYASYLRSTVGVVVDLVASGNNTGDAVGDVFFDIEGLIGSQLADSLRGDANVNVLYGRDGADWLYGRGGNDQIYGDEGNDTLFGNDGNDYIAGGIGDDKLYGGPGADQLVGDAGYDVATYEDMTVGVRIDLFAPGNNTGDALGDTYTGIEAIAGTSFNDVMRGDFGSNTLIGLGGDDFMVGRDGNDWLYGGDGSDQLSGGIGADALIGGAGLDFAIYIESAVGLTADMANPLVNTGEATGDTYYELEGLIGSPGNDFLRGDATGNVIYGGIGDDEIQGRDGNDTLLGETGNDSLLGGTGDDLIYGGLGVDVLNGGTGADFLNGQEDFDTASYANAAAGLIADLQFANLNSGEAAGDNYLAVEGLRGSAFNDSLRGDAGANTIWGGAGIDWLYGRDGNDSLVGESGDDTLFGNAGIDSLLGGDGNDILVGGAGGDAMDGEAGFDLVSYVDATAAVSASMVNPPGNTGDALGDTYARIEGFIGSNFDDRLEGDGVSNTFYGGAGNDTLLGGSGNDILYGEAGDDQLLGGINDDLMIGGSGADVFNGNTGFDTASYAESATGVFVDMLSPGAGSGEAAGDSFIAVEQVIGSAFADTLAGDATANTLYGANGNDFLYGRDGGDALEGGIGADRLDGGTGFDYATYARSTQGVVADLQFAASSSGDAAGDVFVAIEGLIGTGFNDSLRGDAGDNWIYGGAGIDYLYGRDGNDVLLGEDGNDTIQGNAGIDALYGGAGNDRLYGGAGPDTLNGGDGLDFTMYGDAGAAVTVDLAAPGFNSGDAAGDVFVAIEGLSGSNFADLLRGDTTANVIYGEGGGDSIYGRDGGDTLLGGAGNDLLYGEAGDDILWGGDDADLLDGGDGFDYANYSDAASGGVVDLLAWGNNTGMAAGDAYAAIEGVIGSAFDDSLRGTAGANTIYGGGGADWIFGRGGNDILYGEAGNDTLFGNEGDDILAGGAGGDALDGGTGYDTVFYGDATAGGIIDLQLAGNNTGAAAGDSFAGIENVTGTAFADSIRGDAAGNLLAGGDGADYIYGRDGNDVLLGEAGDDTLLGNSGNDLMYGGIGNDSFYFGVGDGKDTIGDFTPGASAIDVIYLSTALGVSNLAAVVARATQIGSDVVITFDANTSLTLLGVNIANLAPNDFVFT